LHLSVYQSINRSIVVSESIYLTKNKIHGTIPSAYGQMTTLKRLQLSRNSLEGTLNGPDFLGPLEKLEIIGLGGNKLSGPLPEELGSMPNIVYINIPYNDFTGSIPSTWGVAGESKLKHVSFAMNKLTGTVPQELAGIESLDNLFLTGNNLRGSVPSFVCSGVDVANVTNNNNNATYNGMKMTVDCESVSCSCCECNGVTPPPSTVVAGVVIDARAENSTITSNTTATNTSTNEGTVSIGSDAVVGADSTVPEAAVDEDTSFFGNVVGTNSNVPEIVVDSSTTNEGTASVDSDNIVDNVVGTDNNVPETVVDSSTTNEGTASVGSDNVVESVVGTDNNVPETVVDSSTTNEGTASVGSDNVVGTDNNDPETAVTTEASDSNAPDASGAAPTNEPESFPFVDDADMTEMIEVLNGALPASAATNRYGCQTIDVGFPCYTSGWSIDFELSNSGCQGPQSSSPPPTTEEYDLVALYPFEGDVQNPPSNVGSLLSLGDSMFWATSCGLAECDGVVANGQVYYRNTYPKQTASLSQTWWPVASGTMMQVQWIRVDASGTAIVLAESQPFLVANSCQ
jgi:hypothetical protein